MINKIKGECYEYFKEKKAEHPSVIENEVHRVEVPGTMSVKKYPNKMRFIYDKENYIDIFIKKGAVFEDVCESYNKDWSTREGFFSGENYFGSLLTEDMIFIYTDDRAYHQATCVAYSEGVLVLESHSTFEEDDYDEEMLEKEYEKTAAFETIFDTIWLVEKDGVLES